jgi:hypothetical protein
MNPAAAMTNTIIMNGAQRRRHDGTPIISRAAKNAPPPPTGQKFGRAEAEEAALVFTVSTAVPFPPAARFMLAGVRLQVGRLCAPGGEAIREQAIPIVPEYVLPALRLTFPFPLDPAEIEDRDVTDITRGATVTFVVAFAVA